MANLSVQPNSRVPCRVVHEGDSFLVVEKPGGVATQPGKGNETNSLLNALFATHGPLLQNLGQPRDFGLLHRLDKEASGLVLVALRREAYDALRAQFAGRRVEKRYLVAVAGEPRQHVGLIRKPILETQGRQKTAKVSPAGKPATTAYRVLQTRGGKSTLECRIGTGRLHQIRVHLASISCPVLGDRVYGDRNTTQPSPRLALHAALLAFDDPDTGDRLVFTSPWPADLKRMTREAGLRPPRAPSLAPQSAESDESRTDAAKSDE